MRDGTKPIYHTQKPLGSYPVGIFSPYLTSVYPRLNLVFIISHVVTYSCVVLFLLICRFPDHCSVLTAYASLYPCISSVY